MARSSVPQSRHKERVKVATVEKEQHCAFADRSEQGFAIHRLKLTLPKRQRSNKRICAWASPMLGEDAE